MTKILLIDNYDSFTYNLAAMFNNYKNIKLSVKTPEEINISEISDYNKIIFSPGPGISTEVPFMDEVMHRYHKTHSILGICLGYQAIALYFGGSLTNLADVNHGKQKQLKIIPPVSKVFEGVAQDSKIGLYHSWVLNKHDLSDSIRIIGECDDGNIMAIEHKKYNLVGLQFHPESFVTECGEKIIDNWINL